MTGVGFGSCGCSCCCSSRCDAGESCGVAAGDSVTIVGVADIGAQLKPSCRRRFKTFFPSSLTVGQDKLVCLPPEVFCTILVFLNKVWGLYYKILLVCNVLKMDRLCCKFGCLSKLMTKTLAYFAPVHFLYFRNL
jgi:hypothetical protein